MSAERLRPPTPTSKGWIIVGITAVTVLMRLPFLTTPGFIGDQGQFLVWSAMTRTEGLSSVYRLRPDGSGKHWCNYPPGYVYVLRLLASLYPLKDGRQLDIAIVDGFARRDGSEQTRWAAGLYKLPAATADVILAVMLFVLLAKRTRLRWAAFISLLYAMAPAVIHNSAVWGQVDAIPTLLVIASLEMARRRRLTWMAVLAVLAALTKPQALIMTPIWLMVAIVHLGRDWRKWIASGAVALAVAVVLLVPFDDQLKGVWRSFSGAAGYYPFTHLNGFSAWFLGNPLVEPHLGDPLAGTTWEDSLYNWYVGDDVPGALGLTARSWGLLAFACVGVYSLVRLWRGRCDDHVLYRVAPLLPLAFFVLSTQMHERYLYPAVAVWAWAARPNARWLIGWVLLGLCTSINVLWAWPGPSETVWATWMSHWLHHPWLGLAPGIWCSGVLVVLLIAALVGWTDNLRMAGAPPSLERSRESGQPQDR